MEEEQPEEQRKAGILYKGKAREKPESAQEQACEGLPEQKELVVFMLWESLYVFLIRGIECKNGKDKEVHILLQGIPPATWRMAQHRLPPQHYRIAIDPCCGITQRITGQYAKGIATTPNELTFLAVGVDT